MKRRGLALLVGSLAIVALGAASCENETESSDLFALVQATSWEAQPGEVVLLSIFATSSGEDLDRLELRSYDVESGLKDIETVKLSRKEQHCMIEYRAPQTTRDTLEQTLLFTLCDASGKTRESSYCFLVVSGEKRLLEEHGSFSIYSNLSGKPDALNLERLATLVSSSDTTSADVVLRTAGVETDPPVFSISSLTDMVFVKSESFDYPNATAHSLRSVFEGSVSRPEASALKTDDIVLIGRIFVSLDKKNYTAVPIAVLKVVSLFDEPGVENDRMLVCVKCIQE